MQHRRVLLVALALVTAGCICHCAAAQQVIDIAIVVEAVKPQVAQAKSSGSPVTIQLQEAFYNVSAPLSIDVQNPVHINIPVTITGQGPDKTVLDCGYVSGAMAILGAGAVSVSNQTIQKCLAAHPYEGAVLIEPSEGVHDMVFNNCRFIGNRAQVSTPPGMGPGPPGGLESGGALLIRPAYQSIPSARLLIDNCTFENNTARDGGAVYTESSYMSVAITNTVFKGNNATLAGGAVHFFPNLGGRGPSAYHPNITHTIAKCAFINNSAGVQAGALRALTFRLNMTDTIFEGNWATPTAAPPNTPPGMAYAVSWYPALVHPPAPSGPVLSIARCSFDNGALQVRGTGGVQVYLTDQTKVLVADSIFKGNNASQGSAMLVIPEGVPSSDSQAPPPPTRPTAYLTITNTSFQNNTETDACNGGFRIVNNQELGWGRVLVNLTVTNSTFGNATQPVCLQAIPPLPNAPGWITDLRPQVDQAIKTGSPIVVTLNASVYNITIPLVIDLTSSQYTNISVTITGQGPDKTVLDCYGYGRAVLVAGAGSVSISNLTIQNCDTTKERPGSKPVRIIPDGSLSGAAVYVHMCPGGRAVSLTNCHFAGNNVVKDASPCISDACALGFGGGAVFMTGTGIGRLFVQSCIFENNVGQIGGGLYAYLTVEAASITDSVFQDNNATFSSGGGLVSITGNGTSFNMTRCRFRNNFAARAGAGLHASAYDMLVTDSSFEGKKAGRADNTSYSVGNGAGAALVAGRGVRVLRSSFTRNYASQRAAGVYVVLTPASRENIPDQWYDTVKGAYVDIQDSLLQDNDAPQASAVWVQTLFKNAAITLTNVTSTNNTGTDCKGGISVVGATSASVTNSTLEGSGTKLCLPAPAPGSPVSRRSLPEVTATHTARTDFPTRRSMHRPRVRISRKQ